jgi:hypothetical protein
MFIRSVKAGLPKLDNACKITAFSHAVAMLFRHVQLKEHCRISTVCYCCKHCFTNTLPTGFLKIIHIYSSSIVIITNLLKSFTEYKK